MTVAIEQPNEPGSFRGDIWFGHPEKRTLGTHRWNGQRWEELPSELDGCLALLANARLERDEAKSAFVALTQTLIDCERRERNVIAERDALQARVDALVEALGHVVAAADKGIEDCPVNNPELAARNPNTKHGACAKCGHGPDRSCPSLDGANYRAVQIARAALSQGERS